MTDVTSDDNEFGPSQNREGSRQDLILAVDLGSSSVRASAYLLNGTRLEETTEFAIPSSPQMAPSIRTFSPIWTEEVISDCLARVRLLTDSPRIIAAAWTSFAMSLAWRRSRRSTGHARLHLLRRTQRALCRQLAAGTLTARQAR